MLCMTSQGTTSFTTPRRVRMRTKVKVLFGKGQDQGFTLIEMLIVILISGILAAVAAPLYLGYIKDAKTAEGKSVAGALWTSVQAQGVAACGTSTNVAVAYPRAGFDSSGVTTDQRWSGSGPSPVTANCAAGRVWRATPQLQLHANTS